MNRLTMATICGGEVQRKVDAAMKAVAENIMDPGTSNKTKRSVTIKITMEPNEELVGDVIALVEVTKKLAPEMGDATRPIMQKDRYTDQIRIAEIGVGQIVGQMSFGDYGIDTETGEVRNDFNVIDMSEVSHE